VYEVTYFKAYLTYPPCSSHVLHLGNTVKLIIVLECYTEVVIYFFLGHIFSYNFSSLLEAH